MVGDLVDKVLARILVSVVISSLLIPCVGFAERVKDLASISGVRINQLVGYGLVVGLDGTGDRSGFTSQSLRNMLMQFGVSLPPGFDPKSKNVAAVSLHAELPPFAKPGMKIDVTTSSISDAKSLRGGSLLLSPLRGADGKVYAMAQGNLVVGGLSAEGLDGSKISVNIPSVGRIPNGATVERSVASPFSQGTTLTLNLHTMDFTTANRLADAINRVFGPTTARALDGASVKVNAPLEPAQRVTFMSLIENLTIDPAAGSARVIVNSRTGTVVINSQVRVMPAAVSHGNLTVTISENTEVSQPGVFAEGTTAVVPRSDVGIREGGDRMFVFNPGVSLNEIVQAVNQVGAGPSDLVAILEALKSAGALSAQLIII